MEPEREEETVVGVNSDGCFRKGLTSHEMELVLDYCKEYKTSIEHLNDDSIRFIIGKEWKGLLEDASHCKKDYWDHAIGLTEAEELHAYSESRESFCIDDPRVALLDCEEKIVREQEQAKAEELKVILRKAIKMLPPQQGFVMSFVSSHDVEGWSMSKIARELGMSPKNFIRLYNKGMPHLRILMDSLTNTICNK